MKDNDKKLLSLEFYITRTKVTVSMVFAFICFLPLMLGSEAVTINTYYPVAYGQGYQKIFARAEVRVDSPSKGVIGIMDANISTKSGYSLYSSVNQLNSEGLHADIIMSAGTTLSFIPGDGRVSIPPEISPDYITRYRSFCYWGTLGGTCPAGFNEAARAIETGTGEGRTDYTTAGATHPLCCKYTYVTDNNIRTTPPT